jgi:hypothetical protein
MDFKKYKKSLKNMSDSVMFSQIKDAVDLKGLLKYVKEKGIKIEQLTEKEILMFTKNKK